jgi:aldehyde dehydrogenase (NAD+)
MGAPKGLARRAQAPSGPQHFGEIIRVMETFAFEEALGTTLLRHEPIGVCVLITPWNWPMNQIATKVAPALAAGCTMVLKPSELAPIDAAILAEVIDSVGVPPGVFNLVHGTGPGIGDALTRHPDVDMVSFTGSTRAGVAISMNAAPTVKRGAGTGRQVRQYRAARCRSGEGRSRPACAAAWATAGRAAMRRRACLSRARLAEVHALAAQAADALSVGLPAVIRSWGRSPTRRSTAAWWA